MISGGSAENARRARSIRLIRHTPNMGGERPRDNPQRRDRLDYIADLVSELKGLSVQANCPALTTLLERAHQEALRNKGRTCGAGRLRP